MRTVLVDMDGVIANWGATYDIYLDSFGNAARRIARHRDQRTFDLHVGCTAAESAIVDSIMDAPGFYAALAPMPGAVDALNGMLAAGHDVRIVTSPWVTNPTCASDKIAWVIRHFGLEWADRMVITRDKTIVQGDLLIDDKPYVTGAHAPSWEHIRFEQPYNLNIPGRRLTRWADWKEAIA